MQENLESERESLFWKALIAQDIVEVFAKNKEKKGDQDIVDILELVTKILLPRRHVKLKVTAIKAY